MLSVAAAICFVSLAASTALAVLLIMKIPQPQVYDFENVPIGLLEGHDGWPTHPNELPAYKDQLWVVPGSGVNPSHILRRNGWGPDITRQQDRNFHFQPFTGYETNAVMQFDIRYGGPNGPSADGYFSTGGEMFGLNNRSFSVLRGGNLTTTAPLPNRIREGDWIRLQLRFNFLARNSLATAGLFYKDISLRDEGFIPVAGLEDIELHIGAGQARKWNTLHINIGSPLDRIGVDNLVPNMASSSHNFERMLALSLTCAALTGLAICKLR
jgi:hypothetical protein